MKSDRWLRGYQDVNFEEQCLGILEFGICTRHIFVQVAHPITIPIFCGIRMAQIAKHLHLPCVRNAVVVGVIRVGRRKVKSKNPLQLP